MEGLERACSCWNEMNSVSGDGLRPNTINAQGLEGLDGVERSKFDKGLDDVEAPLYVSVRLLGETLGLRWSKTHSSKKISSVAVSCVSPLANFCPLVL